MVERETGGRTVVVGVGGGIAAYKACDLVRRLRERGLVVRVAMTPAAQRFVSPLTFQALSGAPPLTDLFEPDQDRNYGHLDLSRGANLLLIAPATADLIARLAAGLADDPVTAVAVAARCPTLLCPAMNVAMWHNERVQANLRTLLSAPRIATVGPAEGLLADGDVGLGRLAEVPDIVEAALRLLGESRSLDGVRVLVTAGPTREALDPVRFLSNPSTGRMGFAVAEAARARGAEVRLVTGPVELPDPQGVEVTRVVTAQELRAAALAALPGCRMVIAAAAVSDYRPKVALSQKQKKGAEVETLELVRTPDVLAELSEVALGGADRPVFVGFAAETEALVESSREKLARKRLDLVVANLVGRVGTGFAARENEAVLVGATGDAEPLPRMDKRALAGRILDRAEAILAARGARLP
ncbi:MAG: bifunctional phosphopantothenoylcysteine decarboxylase/phosphopantothenate--cysteine ligase CoaBC [Deltaproteobacteria bacterium]